MTSNWGIDIGETGAGQVNRHQPLWSIEINHFLSMFVLNLWMG